MIFISVNVYITVQLPCNACVSLAEPYYDRQLIQFAHIPVEFVVCFIRYQNCMKVITFSIAAQYLSIILYLHTIIIDFYAVSEYNFQSCTQHALSQYHRDKALHFPGKFHFLVKTITDQARNQGGCTGCVRTPPQAPMVRILILSIQVKECSRLN